MGSRGSMAGALRARRTARPVWSPGGFVWRFSDSASIRSFLDQFWIDASQIDDYPPETAADVLPVQVSVRDARSNRADVGAPISPTGAS
jgi:hypothetical protein